MQQLDAGLLGVRFAIFRLVFWYKNVYLQRMKL